MKEGIWEGIKSTGDDDGIRGRNGSRKHKLLLSGNFVGIA